MNTYRLNNRASPDQTRNRLAPVGFSAQFEDFREEGGGLDALLVKNRLATYRMRAEGDSMVNAGIHHDDLLIVDRSLAAQSGDIVIAMLEGDLVVRVYSVRGMRRFLQPENPRCKTVEITGREDVYIWGVATYVVHKLGGKTVGAG